MDDISFNRNDDFLLYFLFIEHFKCVKSDIFDAAIDNCLHFRLFRLTINSNIGIYIVIMSNIYEVEGEIN